MSDRLITALVALGLASLVWLYTRSRDREVLDNYPVPVELEVAAGQADQYELEVTSPGQVLVSFAGPPSRVRELRGMLQQAAIRVHRSVAVPEERQGDPRYAEVIRIDPAEVPTLPGVKTIIAENQNRIAVTLRRLIEKRLPVRLDSTPSDRLDQVVVEPSTVLVRGPKEVLEGREFIATQLYPVPSKPGSDAQPLDGSARVKMIRELDGRQVRVTPAEVFARFTVKPRQQVYDLRDVPIHFLCPVNFSSRPRFLGEREGKVSLKVLGPVSEGKPAVTAFVDLSARKFGDGFHSDEPIRVQLPPGFQLVQDPPPRLKASFELVPAESPAKPVSTAFPISPP